MTSKLNPPISNQKTILTEFEAHESAKDRHNTICKTCGKRDGSDYGTCCRDHFEEMMIVNTFNQLELLLQTINVL